MKVKAGTFLSCVALILGCNPKTPAPNNSLSLHQVMEWVIDPNDDVIWDSVKSISTTKGTTEIYPRTDEQWDAVRNSAAILVKAGNILLVEGRAKDNTQWLEYAKQLSKASEVALKAAQDKNKDALFDAGGGIYEACKACHDKYADFDKKAPK